MSDTETRSIPAAEARKNLGELVAEAFYRKTRVRITRNGKDFAAIVPIEDLEMLQALEDRHDIEISRERLAGEDRIPMKDLLAKLDD